MHKPLRFIKSLHRDVRELAKSFKRHIGTRKKTRKMSLKLSNSIKARLATSSKNKNNTSSFSLKGGQQMDPLEIKYGTALVAGQKMTKEQTHIVPELMFNVDTRTHMTYVTVMTDPDAPGGTFTHMVATYDPNTRLTNYSVPYFPPSPPSGTHRYQFQLYGIPSGNGKVAIPAMSSNRVLYTSTLIQYLIGKRAIKLGPVKQFLQDSA